MGSLERDMNHKCRGAVWCAWRVGGASLLGSVATLLLACTPPDRPARFSEPLPEQLLAYLEPDSIIARFLHEGPLVIAMKPGS